MREININIEGYNVNGICVGCLNHNRTMFYKDEVKECFKILADIDVPDGLTIQVCWECLAYVQRINQFKDQILRSYDILLDYSRKHTFLNSPRDLTQYAAQNLVHTRISQVSFDVPVEIEVESDLKMEETDNGVEVKIEPPEERYLEFDVDADPNSNLDLDYYNNETVTFQDDNVNVSSDEDVQLSKLKKKKEKRDKKSKKRKNEKTKNREKKKKRNRDKNKDCEKENKTDEKLELKSELVDLNEQPVVTRKLKNLPLDSVELFTMTEDELWQVRSEDVCSKEFIKLKYKCDKCLLGFNTEKLMQYHMNGKHRLKTASPSASQQCDVCKAYFLVKDNLAIHRSLHLSAYRCKHCGYKTTLKIVMAKHLTLHYDGEETYECSTCNHVFNSKSKLSYHKNICHQEKPRCDCCGKVFANKMTLKYHLKILPQNKDGDTPKEKLYIPCKGCDKVFHSKKSYRAHVVIHNGLKYPCPICNKLFQWKRNLARHTRNHKERDAGALHECRECGKTFASRDCYNNHMKLSKKHTPEELYTHVCSFCGKKYPTKWCLVDHIDWDHLKRIKYQCSICFKAFKTAKIKVAHMNNIHEGRQREPEGEHLCEICGKSYKTVKRLKGHVWAMHTNRSTTKSFKCKLCPATFTWQTSIYKHTKMMHDFTKKGKQPRSIPPADVKKQDTFPEMDLNRIQYYQPSVPPLIFNIERPVSITNDAYTNLQT